MNSNFLDSGIRAIHKVVIVPRGLAYENSDPHLLARILDHADALGFMLMADFRDFEGEDTPSLFRRHLQGIEETFDGFKGLTYTFDENMKRGEANSQQPRELAAASA